VAAVKRRSLWPREHGAYGQLGAPILGALLVRAPAAAAIALAAAACLAFFANEPLLVVLGQRGERMRSTHGRIAVRRLVIALTGAVTLGLVGLARSSTATLEIAAIAALPAACLASLAWSRRQHTIGGELLAAVTFPAASAPVIVASGGSIGQALALWAAWSVGYVCSVVAVHRVLVRHRHPASWTDRMLAVLLTAVVIASFVTPCGAFAAPLVIAASWLVVCPPRATHMRAIGVALVIASLVGDVILLDSGTHDCDRMAVQGARR
jgi:hypothetical protein